MIELGLIGRKALALRPKFGFETRQLCFRDQSFDPIPTGPALARPEPEHLAAASGDRRCDPARGARGRYNGELVHRFEQMRRRRCKGLLHRNSAGQAERKLGAVDAMIAAIDQSHCAIDDLEAERSLHHRLADAVLDGRYPLLGYRSAVDLLFEYEAVAPVQRTDLDDDVAELAMAARLLLVAAVLPDRFADRFAIADRRRVGFYLDTVPALKLGKHRVEVLVVDAAQPDFMIGLVMLDDEAPVFFREPMEGA